MNICTVLLITYNHAPYIRKAIESVLEQKTKYPFVIHIFDDASNDGTSDIVREYAEKYPEKIIPFIAEQNQGAQTNIWNAYKSVNTKYCALLECDDYWCDENKLELQITALEEHPECSFCGGNTVIKNIDESCKEYENNSLALNNPILQKHNIFNYKDFEPITTGGYIPYVGTRLIRTSNLELDSVKSKETVLFDFTQFYWLLLKGDYYYINKTFHAYQRTGHGLCSSVEPLRFLNQFIQNCLDFNIDTDFKIADKIFSEMILQTNFRLYLSKKNIKKNKSLISKLWKNIYTNPTKYIKGKLKGITK